MALLLVIGPVLPAGAQGLAHVRQAQSSAVLVVVVEQGDLLVAVVKLGGGLFVQAGVGLGAGGLVLGPQEQHRAAEGVGVGHHQGALGAVDLEPGLLGVVHVEGGEQLGDGTIGEQDVPGEVGVHVHGDVLPVVGLGGDGAVGEGLFGKAHHALGLP